MRFRKRRAGKAEPPYCQHPEWPKAVGRVSKLSGGQLDAWGTAVCYHAARLLEQGADGPDGADQIVLAGLSLMALGFEQQRRAED